MDDVVAAVDEERGVGKGIISYRIVCLLKHMNTVVREADREGERKNCVNMRIEEGQGKFFKAQAQMAQ